MLRQFIKSLIIMIFILSIFAGCAESTNEKQYSDELSALKKEINVLKDSISKDDQMQIEIDNLKEEIEQIKAKKDVKLEALVYSCNIIKEDVEVIIDFKKEDEINRDIIFIVLSGNIKNQRISDDHNVIRYDEVLIPGKGVLGTDDVPEDVKRYRIVFPSRNDYVYNIIAIEENTGSFWQYEINSSMMGDI